MVDSLIAVLQRWIRFLILKKKPVSHIAISPAAIDSGGSIGRFVAVFVGQVSIMEIRTSVALVLVFLITSVGSISAQEAQREPVLILEGNKVFSRQELLGVADKCLAASSNWHDRHDSETLEYCLRRTQLFMIGKGYLRAVIGKPNREDIEGGVRIVVPIQEGVLYRLGEITFTDSKLFSPAQLLEMGSLKTGDIASGEAIGEWLYERVAKAYGNFGYLQYAAEVEPEFHLASDAAREGVVDLTISIDEGQAFTIRTIKFDGNGNVRESILRREMLLRNGDVFSRERFNDSLKIINQMGAFEQIDSDKDVDYRVDNESARLDITIHLKKRT